MLKPAVIGTLLMLGMGISLAVVFASDQKFTGMARDGAYCSSEGGLTDEQPIQSHRSYCVKSEADGQEFVVGESHPFTFSIVDDRGEKLSNFAESHTKIMHMMVVRDDLQGFQHVHPFFDPQTSEFTLPDLSLAENGNYRIFADFVPAEGMNLPVTSFIDLQVGGAYKPVALESEDRNKIFGDFEATLLTNDYFDSGVELQFSLMLKESGLPVTDLEDYLGALAHSVILREDTLDFIHVHALESADDPQDGQIDFVTTFPSAGKYKIFTQIQRDGEVITTDFVVNVTDGEGEQSDAAEHQGH